MPMPSNTSRIPVRSKSSGSPRRSNEHGSGCPSPAFKYKPFNTKECLKRTLIPIWTKKKAKLDNNESAQEVPKTLGIHLPEPPASVDPSDISFVDEPIKDLQAALIGLIPPFSNPSSPRVDCTERSPSIHKQQPFFIPSQEELEQSRTQLKDFKSNHEHFPPAVQRNISTYSFLEETEALSDIEAEDVSIYSLFDEDDLSQSNYHNYENNLMESASILDTDSIFADFPDSDQEISLQEEELTTVFQHRDPEKAFTAQLSKPNFSQSTPLKDNPSSGPREYGDGYHLLYQNKGQQTEKQKISPPDQVPYYILQPQSSQRTNIHQSPVVAYPLTHLRIRNSLKNIAGINFLAKSKRIDKFLWGFENKSIKQSKDIDKDEFKLPIMEEKTEKTNAEEKEEQSECQVELPKVSTIIMRQMTEEEYSLSGCPTRSNLASFSASNNIPASSSVPFSERRYIAKFTIHNPTSDVYGFKVYCNKAALGYLTVSSKQGVIKPSERLVVLIRTKKLKKYGVTNEKLANAKLAVKTFPFYHSDPNELNTYLSQLIERRPDLVKTEKVNKVILIYSGDLLSTTKLLDAFKNRHKSKSQNYPSDSDETIFENNEEEGDELLRILMNDKEREVLKQKLHTEYIREVLPTVHSRSVLHSLKMRVLMVNQQLRIVVGWMGGLETFMQLSTFVIICFCCFQYIVPFLNTTVVVEEEKGIFSLNWNSADVKYYKQLPFYHKAFYLLKKWGKSTFM